MLLVLIFAGVWITIGLFTALWMARRGHRDPGWLFLCLFFGPVMALAASERIQRYPGILARTETGQRRPGQMKVLVGVDGSAQAQQALEFAVHRLGPHADTLVVAEVVDYDTPESEADGRITAVRRRLADVIPSSGEPAIVCEVLVGPPAQALLRFAEEQNIDIIVVGRHGKGLSKRLLGNVPQELLRAAAVPVLVADGGANTAARTGPCITAAS